MIPGMTPERLPDDIGTAPTGRYAAWRKIRDEAIAKKPTDDEAKPDSLLSRGVFIPSPDKK